MGGGASATLCADRTASGDRALGAAYATNQGTSDITITSVTPVEAAGVDVGRAYAILEDGSDNGYAVGGEIPPSAESDSATAWKRRVEAVGAVIAPGETWQLILSVRVTSPADAYFKALRVEYVEDGSSRVAENTTEVGVTGYGPCA